MKRRTAHERLAEAVYEMGVDEAEKFFNFIKAFGNASKKEKPKAASSKAAAAKAATATPKTD